MSKFPSSEAFGAIRQPPVLPAAAVGRLEAGAPAAQYLAPGMALAPHGCRTCRSRFGAFAVLAVRFLAGMPLPLTRCPHCGGRETGPIPYRMLLVGLSR